jgi:putative MATE family efflux protein
MAQTAPPDLLSGPIYKTSLKLAIPVLIGQFVMLMYGIINSVFISMLDRTSTSYISAIGLVFPINMLFLAMGIGLFTGVSSVLARAFGEQNMGVIQKISKSSLSVTLLLSVSMTLLLYLFSGPVIEFLAGSQVRQATKELAQTYLWYVMPGFLLVMINQTLLGLLMAQGLFKYYTISIVLSTVLNTCLDPLFIFTLKMGVAGAGLATSVSVLASTLYLLTAFSPKKSFIQLNLVKAEYSAKVVGQILKIGLPHIGGILIINIGSMALNSIIGSVSETALNSWVLVLRADEFILLIGYALASSTLIMVGQNYGSANIARVKEIILKNLIMSVLAGLFFVLCYNLFAHNLFEAFSGLPEVVRGSVEQVRILSATYICVVIGIVVNAGFQAMGKPLPGFLAEIIRMLVVTIPLSYYYVIVQKQDVIMAFYVFAAANIFVMLLSLIWIYRSLKSVHAPVLNLQTS